MGDPVKRTALVTGASTGIGEAIARELATRGFDLVVVARDRTRLETLAAELNAQQGTNVEVLAADLTEPSELAKVEARVADGTPAIDVLVNNAGYGTVGEFHTLDVEREQNEVQLNVVALLRLTHAALGPMVARGSGGILNVASIGAFQPIARMATYGATKAFVGSLSQAIHEEVKGTGVHVTVLCPGFTRTEFQQRSGATAGKLPSFVWQDAATVARAGLDDLEKNKAIAVPGALNKVTSFFADAAPSSLTRRVAARMGKYYES